MELRLEDICPEIFFTSDSEQHYEEVFINVIPKARHREYKCLESKKNELRNFEEYNAYDIGDEPQDAHQYRMGAC